MKHNQAQKMSHDDVPVQQVEDDDDNDPEEYNVEAIRSKRFNPKSKTWEYRIKWENFPEEENTWEPKEHLKCPEIIQKFEEEWKKNKRTEKAQKLARSESNNKRLKTTHNDGASTSGRSTRKSTEGRDIFVEIDDDDEDDDDDSDTRSQNNRVREQTQNPQPAQVTLKGFERGLALDSILSASLDENEKLWFVVKWDGCNSVEMIAYEEMLEKAPKELCKWYTDRLYWSVNSNGQSQKRPVTNNTGIPSAN